MSRKAENQKLLENKFVRAALETISKSEGTNGDYKKMVYGLVIKSPLHPALVGKTNVELPDLSRFPNILVRVNSKGLNSSAAGKYQILQKTYLGAAKVLGVSDFSENTQDLIAVELIRQRGALPYIVKGDFKGALEHSTINQEWASFAGAGYGQGENSNSKLLAWFNDAAKIVGGVVKDNPKATAGGSAAVVVIAALAFFF